MAAWSILTETKVKERNGQAKNKNDNKMIKPKTEITKNDQVQNKNHKKIIRIQNSENDWFKPSITFHMSLKKYIKLINSFRLGRHRLRQDIDLFFN